MKNLLIHKLNESNAYRNSRMNVCDFVLENNLTDALIQIAFDLNDANHFKAFWALEFVCEKKITVFIPYIDPFCNLISQVTNDSAARSATKIVLFLTIENHQKSKISLTQNQESLLINSSLDRLIHNDKVASKVYAMKTLFIFGKKHPWIYDDLKPIIAQDAYHHSAAYQAAARNILKKLY